MEWIATHWQPALLSAAAILAALGIGWVVVFALIHIHRGIRRLAEVQLDIARVRRDQAALQAVGHGDQIAVLRKELRDCEARLKDAIALAGARERLLAAQEENLAGRAKALAALERDLAALQRRHDDERSRHLATDARAKQAGDLAAGLQAQVETARLQAAQAEQAASMLDGQVQALQQNAAMLNTTVADLNAKRDLLTQENRHLQERLDQESALRAAVSR